MLEKQIEESRKFKCARQLLTFKISAISTVFLYYVHLGLWQTFAERNATAAHDIEPIHRQFYKSGNIYDDISLLSGRYY